MNCFQDVDLHIVPDPARQALGARIIGHADTKVTAGYDVRPDEEIDDMALEFLLQETGEE